MKQSIFLLLFLLTITTYVKAQNVDSLLKVIESIEKDRVALQSNLSELTAKNNELIKEKATLITDKEALTERLKAVDKTLPTSIKPGQIEIHDDKVFAEFLLNTKGTVVVSVFKKGNTRPDIEKISSNYDKNPIVQIQPLLPDQDYYIVATIVDYAGKETATKATNEIFDQLNIHTKKRIERPNIQLNTPVLSSDAITVPIISDDSRIAASYSYYKIIKSNDQRNRILSGSYNTSITQNKFGKIEQVSAISEIKIPNLQSQTDYDLDVIFYNEYGKISQTFSKTYTTSSKPVELNFIGGLNINLNVLKTTISWKTTKKATEAFVNFETSDGKTDIQTKADIKNDSCFVVLDFDSYNKILGLKTKNTLSEMPVINAIVKDDNGLQKKASFKISFSIPSQQEIATSNGVGLTEDKKKALKESASEISKLISGENPSGNKIKWNKIVEIGLPIVLSLL